MELYDSAGNCDWWWQNDLLTVSSSSCWCGAIQLSFRTDPADPADPAIPSIHLSLEAKLLLYQTRLALFPSTLLLLLLLLCFFFCCTRPELNILSLEVGMGRCVITRIIPAWLNNVFECDWIYISITAFWIENLKCRFDIGLHVGLTTGLIRRWFKLGRGLQLRSSCNFEL